MRDALWRWRFTILKYIIYCYTGRHRYQLYTSKDRVGHIYVSALLSAT